MSIDISFNVRPSSELFRVVFPVSAILVGSCKGVCTGNLRVSFSVSHGGINLVVGRWRHSVQQLTTAALVLPLGADLSAKHLNFVLRCDYVG